MFGPTAILFLGIREREEEEEWAGIREWDSERIQQRRDRLERWIAQGMDDQDPWRRQFDVDLARACERPAFFGLARGPEGIEIPDVDTSPTMERNVLVEEVRRMERPKGVS